VTQVPVGSSATGTAGSLSKRFTSAFIAVVTVILVACAAVVIVVNVRRIDRELRDTLDDTARLAQISLPVAVWNLETDLVRSFTEALLLRDPLAFVEVLSEGQSMVVQRRDPRGTEIFADFERSSAFLVKTADIVHQGKGIGSVRLAVSRASVRQAILWNVAGTLAITVVSIAAISVTSILITRRYIARPLAALQASAGRIAGGNLDAGIDTTQGDEIGRLARDLDVMRGSLRSLLDERRQNEQRLEEVVAERTAELTRTVNELRALGEVGGAVNSTLDLATVLTVIVSNAVRITGTEGGAIYEYEPATQTFDLRATHEMEPELIAALRARRPRLGEGAVGRAAARRQPVQIADIEEDRTNEPRLYELFSRHGFRARLAVPLLREEEIVGALVVRRRLPGPFAPELAELLQTFAAQSVLAIQNAHLFREIADKSRQLEVASRHKSEFLASMSHELRTPLNAILGFNEMILGGVYGELSDDLREPLADIQSSGRHLLRLINNILDLSKIEAGRMELAIADYSVHDAVDSVRSSLRSLAEDKGLEFVATVPDNIPLARGDGGRIIQCLVNLAGNALKFTRHGRVEITAELRDGELLVYRVTDTGIGIAPDKIDALFDEFRQGDASIASEFGGTGLGLSITRKFVELHKGRIWVDSELGRGSTFFIGVPLRLNGGTTS
jgi:signal transduction histidine kinase/HAMP domain-containing protein